MQEKQICQRCHREMTEETICGRCQDVLEFGYPSFPFYELEEHKEREPVAQ